MAFTCPPGTCDDCDDVSDAEATLAPEKRKAVKHAIAQWLASLDQLAAKPKRKAGKGAKRGK